MSVSLLVITFGALLLLFLGSGMYIGAGLGAVGIIGFEFFVKVPTMISTIMFTTIDSITLTAVPLFLFMGWIVFHSGVSGKLYSGVSKWTSVIPGGLLHSNIVSCSIFAAVSGSSVATAGTLGAVAYPEQKARGYSRGIVTGSLAAGGTLGILIPPSVTMIIYGAFVGASVGKLFMGGVFPGIILAFLFSAWIFFRTLTKPSLVPKWQPITRRYFWTSLLAFKEVWPILLIIGTIMGGIYGGIMTPTEAAGAASFEAMVIAAFYRKLNFTVLKKSALSALETTAMILFIMIGAKIMGQALSMLKVPAQIAETLGAMDVSPLVIWLGIVVMYLIMGCFMDGISMMLLTLPVTYPLLVTTLGFDPIWFGVLLTILIEIGLITPPVGINVYVIHGITGGENISEVFKGIIPFLICMLLIVALLTFLPDIVTWLPTQMLG